MIINQFILYLKVLVNLNLSKKKKIIFYVDACISKVNPTGRLSLHYHFYVYSGLATAHRGSKRNREENRRKVVRKAKWCESSCTRNENDDMKKVSF